MKFRLLCILAVFFTLILANHADASAQNQETSVVSLKITSQNVIISKNPDFELLDFGDYILLPVNALSVILKLEIDFQRDRNTVIIISKRLEREAEIDLISGFYKVKTEGDWQGQPPVVMNADFYVSPRLIEYLAGVNIIWNSKDQELIIDGDWITPKEKLPVANISRNNQSITPADVLESQPLEGTACSIGAIEYKLVTENRADASGSQIQTGAMSIRSDGRAGPWTISAETNIGYDPLEGGQYAELTRIRGQYEDQYKTIILGDSELELDQTLGVKDLRGITCRTPDQEYHSKLFAFTAVSGNAEPGDKVKLFVNGELVRELSVQDQNLYMFRDVSLRLKRINIIKVTIEKNNGQIVEDTRKIAAIPQLLIKGDMEYLLAYGDIRQPGIEYWEGKALAVRMNHGLTDWATFQCEITRTTPYDPLGVNEDTINSGDIGFAFQVGNGLIYTVDWLVSGGENGDPLENGWETSLLTEMEHGSFEVIAFNIPNQLTKGLRQIYPGRGLKILDETELSPNKMLAITGSFWRPVPENDTEYANEYEIKYIDKDIQTLKSVALQNNINQNSDYMEEQLGLIFEYSLRKKDLTINGNLNLLNLDIIRPNATLNSKTASLDCNLLKRAGKSLLFGVGFNPVISWCNGINQDYQFITEAVLKWNSRNTWISMAGSIVGENKFGEECQTMITKQKLAGTASYYLMKNMNMNYHYEYILDQLNYPYTTNEFRFIYQPPSDHFRVWGDIKYISPVPDRDKPQWSYSSGIQINFPSGLELVLESERLYETLWSTEASDIIRLTLQQSIGFGGGQIRTFRYSDDENLSFVSGTVYLDENGNGKMDRNEQRIAGIKMMLDGGEAMTNNAGIYMFNSVEPGIYRVDFNLKSLPADYTPKIGEQLIKIKSSENMILDFGLTINGSIAGKVFIDANSDGKIGPEDQPLQWAGIILDDQQKVYTSADGSFYFENVPLGGHTVKVIPETIPKGMQIHGERSYQVIITQKSLDVKELVIPVGYKFIE